MYSWKRSNLTTDPSLQVTSLQNSQRAGTLSTVHLHQGTPGAMDKQSLLTHAKCSGQDPYLALLAYRSTPVDSHLRSPAEMLYQHALCTTVPQRIRHKDPYAAAERERLEEHAT